MKQMSRRVPEEIAADTEEINEAIRSLTRAELLKLERYAKWRIRGIGRASEGRNHEDLMQDAVTQTLSGQRSWNKSVSFVQYLIGVIRSISSHWKEQFDPDSALLESEAVYASPEGKEKNLFLDAPSTAPDAERLIMARQEIKQIEILFSDDHQALEVITGWRLEMSGPEIQKELGISQKEHETIARRIRRNVRPSVPDQTRNSSR
jgi:DNA-directed RNA polymerase specialized sigma24 family protein